MAGEDYSVKTKVTADVSNFEKGMNKAEKSLKGFSSKLADSIDRLGKKGLIGSIANVSLAVGGLTQSFNTVARFAREVGKAINECTEAYKAQVIAERALDVAIQNNPFISGASSEALKQFASEMQKVSNYGDEQLIPMMTNLVSLGRTEAETMQLISVAMDMSAGMGISLDTAITQLNATLNGNIGRLGQQNAELKGLTEEELKQGRAVEILGEKFKGLSSATADTSKQLKNIKGDFKEAIGEFTLPSSDMWNRFWAGFYERGIAVINEFNAYLDAQIIGKKIAGFISEQLIPLEYYGDRINYLRDVMHTLSEEEIKALENYLKALKDPTEEQKQILNFVEQEKLRRSDILEIQKQFAEEKAKEQRQAQGQAETEDRIAKLKEKYLAQIAEQEAKWNNINRVTGQAVKNEEKIKYYQDQLVGILTEANGQITEQNQYYKDQMAIIEELKKLQDEEKESSDDAYGEIVQDTKDFVTQIKKAFENLTATIQEDAEDWTDVVSNAYNTISETFGTVFEDIGESLVAGGKGFQNYAGTAVKALAQVLKGLGEQLVAISAVNLATKQYASAAIAAAGAAAAFVASGVLSAVANSMMTTSEETKEASTQIERVGNVAITSSYSLEEFVNKLKEIKGLFTGTSVSIMQTYRGLSSATQIAISEYQKATNAFNEYSKQAQSALEFKALLEATYDSPLSQKFRMLSDRFLSEEEKQQNREKAINEALGEDNIRIIKTYEELKAKVEEMGEAYRKASLEVVNLTKNTIANYKASITENRVAIANYYEVLDAQRKVRQLESQWASMSASQRQADINKYQSIVNGGVGDITSTLTYQLELYRGFVESLLLEQKANVQALTSAVYTEVSKTGTTIGNTLVKSIISGATKADFLNSMKEYISETLMQIAIYTESFEDKLAEVGAKLSRALLGVGDTDLQDVRSDLESLWEDTEKKAKKAGEIIKQVFGDIKTEVTTNIKTFGNEIASTLVDSLANGLGQSDFLDTMKNYIRKMLIQTVVYTDSLKAEIESISNAISKGLTEGFTETTFHEIRRDLSWTFDQANRSIENIDSIMNSIFGSGYATGTNNATAGLHLVGEAGPELVRFRGGEQVLNAGNTQKALSNAGGTVVNQNVTFNNLQDTTAFAMMNQLKQYNRQMAINGVI